MGEGSVILVADGEIDLVRYSPLLWYKTRFTKFLLNPQLTTAPPTRLDRWRRAKHDRKIAQSSTVVEAIDKLQSEGFTIVYTDSRSKKVQRLDG